MDIYTRSAYFMTMVDTVQSDSSTTIDRSMRGIVNNLLDYTDRLLVIKERESQFKSFEHSFRNKKNITLVDALHFMTNRKGKLQFDSAMDFLESIKDHTSNDNLVILFKELMIFTNDLRRNASDEEYEQYLFTLYRNTGDDIANKSIIFYVIIDHFKTLPYVDYRVLADRLIELDRNILDVISPLKCSILNPEITEGSEYKRHIEIVTEISKLLIKADYIENELKALRGSNFKMTPGNVFLLEATLNSGKSRIIYSIISIMTDSTVEQINKTTH